MGPAILTGEFKLLWRISPSNLYTMYSGSLCTSGMYILCFHINTILPSTGLASDWSDQNVCLMIGRPIQSCCHSSSRNIWGLHRRKTASSKQPIEPDTHLHIFFSSFKASDIDIFSYSDSSWTEMPDKNIESLLSAALAKVSSTDCTTCSQNFCHTKSEVKVW